MNIAFVNSTRKWGGVKTWCIDTAFGLSHLGVRPIIFGRDERFILRSQKIQIESYKINFGFDYNPIVVSGFYFFFKKNNIEHVILNVGKDLKSAGIAAKLAGIPITVHIGNGKDIVNKFENRILHSFLRPSYICCSEYTRSEFLEFFPKAKYFNSIAIHPGTTISNHVISTKTPLTIITTSRLSSAKRHIDLINACKIMAGKGLKFKLRIVGEGELLPVLKDLSKNLLLDDFIEFAGHVNNVSKELKSADIFVLPTDCEPLGIALEEAMAHGLIPVARNIGGPPEIWPSFIKHFLLPPKSGPSEFSDLLSELLIKSPDEMNELKNRIREHASRSFSISNQSKKFLDFLQNIKNNN